MPFGRARRIERRMQSAALGDFCFSGFRVGRSAADYVRRRR